VTLSGTISRNATPAGGDVHLTDSSYVKGSVLIGAGNLMVGGQSMVM